MFLKNRNKIKPIHILLAILPGLIVAGLLVFANPTQRASITAPVESGLVGYWNMDSSDIYGSTLYDKSGQGNHATIYGAATTTGKIKQALSFDGVNDYVRIPNSSSLNPGADMTMIAWIYWRGGSGDHNIITKENAYEFRVNNNYINYATNPWAWRGGTSAPILTGKWHHIVITHKGDGLQKIYIDGGEKYSASSGGNIVINDSIVTIGARYGGTASFFNGLIDEVRIYNRALTASEVSQNYNSAKRAIIDTTDEERRTIITPASLDG